MGQQEVIKLLMNNPGKKFRMNQICAISKTNKVNTSRACRILVKNKEINADPIKKRRFIEYLYYINNVD